VFTYGQMDLAQAIALQALHSLSPIVQKKNTNNIKNTDNFGF
jgi:hypothetical protein